MSSFHTDVKLAVKGHVTIKDLTTGETLLDKDNAVHPQNMARVITRAMANEDNAGFYRLAFGNGGTFIDAGLNVIVRESNDGNNGAGWEARLYREVYSEVIDETSGDFGTDPGSAGPDNVRVGGGTVVAGDPVSGNGTTSDEVGKDSALTINMTINESEPLQQAGDFVFDEMGIYTAGRPAINTAGVSAIDIKNKDSSEDAFPAISGSTDYGISVIVDGVLRESTVTTPAAASGNGTGGAFTYGDICEGINTGAWLKAGSPFDFSAVNGAFFVVSDTSGGVYPSITGQATFGFLNVESKTNGSTSSVSFPESTTVLGNPSLIYSLAISQWSNANVNSGVGRDAGVINNHVDQSTERERLLTHLVFEPIAKLGSSVIQIIYTITIVVAESEPGDSNIIVTTV